MLKPCMLAIAFSILTFCPVNARADTVSLSGSVTVSGFFGTFDLSFSGTNSDGRTFGASGHGSTTAGISFPRPINVVGGTSINLGGSAFLIRSDFAFGSVRIDGTSYVPHEVDIIVSSTLATVPVTDAETVVLTAPCTVQGGVSGEVTPFTVVGIGFNGNCTARLTLFKSGTESSGNGRYTFQSISYSFSSPVPEPMTVTLFSSGLVGIIIGLRRKRAKMQSQ